LSTIAQPTLTAETVSVGQQLPPLEHDVTATTVVLGALASRDWRPMHHDKEFAIQRNGVADIFINTPNNAAWFERYITDWTGPTGRLGRMKFKMSSSVFPGDRMLFAGTVKSITSDAGGCCWLELDIAVTVAGEVSTRCLARVAIPAHADDNPWQRRGENWLP
jgi:acyl dehydratase